MWGGASKTDPIQPYFKMAMSSGTNGYSISLPNPSVFTKGTSSGNTIVTIDSTGSYSLNILPDDSTVTAKLPDERYLFVFKLGDVVKYYDTVDYKTYSPNGITIPGKEKDARARFSRLVTDGMKDGDFWMYKAD